MINLKTIGLALIAVFAFAAMSTSAASASTQGMLTSDGEFWLHGTDTGEPSSRPLTAFGGKTECETAHYLGGAVGPSATEHHEGLNSGATEFTLAPTYTNCQSGGGLPETVTMNGCDFDFKIGTTIEAGVWSATAGLNCETGSSVLIEIFANEEAHTNGEVLCALHVPEQGGLGGATIGSGMEIGGTVEGITMVSTCGHEPPVTEVGKLDLSIALTGSSAPTSGTKAVTISDETG